MNIQNFIFTFIFLLSVTFVLTSCGTNKTVLKGNKLYKYVDNQTQGNGSPDSLVTMTVEKHFVTEIIDKSNYYIIKTSPKSYQRQVESVKSPVISKLALGQDVYTNETDIVKDEKSFKYLDAKFAIQTLTIPIKFRSALEDKIKFPAQVESGVNLGLAPVMKWNLNIFNPSKKYMGKILNTYSVNTGALLNVGAVELNKETNAVGLASNRKSGVFTCGGFIMFGVNNFNIGYAVGWDRVIGEGSSYWAYQGKLWHGFVIALDIIKN